MQNVKDHIKILSTLSLASSDTREDTLSSVITSLVFGLGCVKIEEIPDLIKEEFGFEPYDPELNPLIQKLVDDGKLNLESNVLSLTLDEQTSHSSQETQVQFEDKQRFQNFKAFLETELELSLDIKQVKKLWDVFLQYLYNSFYEYGHDAIKTLHPHIQSDDENTSFEDILQVSLNSVKEFDLSLVSIFKTIVERFPDFASPQDISFINDLAQKTLSFSSLGIQPELANGALSHDLIDWTLYLDTNVLFSVLDLHSHPENNSCNALIQLIRENHDYIKIKLRYSELTERELNKKKSDFKTLDEKLSTSAINAVLKSGKIDDFSKNFYEKLRSNRSTTVHPSQIIELSQATLKVETIEIGRNKTRLEHLGEDYIQTRMDDYLRFIDTKNRLREEFAQDKEIEFRPIYKSESQVRHDISLREILLDSRKVIKEDIVTMNNMRFFAVTLDDLLIEYDREQTKNYGDKQSFPVFFKPSFLLNKLIKILPIKTVDYKKAFVKAITTRGFYKDVRKSQDILKIVSYLKSKGIDDEQVIYNLISQEIFLERFRQSTEEKTSEEFIESELNREFKQKESELQKATEELNSTSNKIGDIESKNKSLEAKKDELEETLRVYRDSINKLSARVLVLEEPEKTIKSQPAIDFARVDENTMLKTDLKKRAERDISNYKRSELKKWQRRIWLNLFWVLPVTICGIAIWIPNQYVHIYDKNGETNYLAATLLGIIGFILDSYFLKLVIDRHNESQKSAKMNNIIIPDDLQNELDKYSN